MLKLAIQLRTAFELKWSPLPYCSCLCRNAIWSGNERHLERQLVERSAVESVGDKLLQILPLYVPSWNSLEPAGQKLLHRHDRCQSEEPLLDQLHSFCVQWDFYHLVDCSIPAQNQAEVCYRRGLSKQPKGESNMLAEGVSENNPLQKHERINARSLWQCWSGVNEKAHLKWP